MGASSREFITHNLMPGESVVSIAHIHPLVLVSPAIIAGFGLFLILGGLAVGGGFLLLVFIGVSAALVGGAAVVILMTDWLTTECSCTDRRIVIKTGLLTTRLREMPLGKVEALVVEQGLLGKLFGYGTLVFKGSGGTRRVCKNIESPMTFYRCVQEQVALAQKHS